MDPTADKPSWLRGTHEDPPGRIGGILFADVVGFSDLSDTQVVRFYVEFLGIVARLLDAPRRPPIARNTWGDGLYLVFPQVRDAGVFALDLCNQVARTSWAAAELPEMSVRVGLHAGPLFEFVDRVTGQLSFSGRHATRAARIEPVTPPGTVYASREFAALAAAYRVKEFVCEPVGGLRLAKAAGVAPLFTVRRSVNPERGRPGAPRDNSR
jgi:class 3 adenylate cyclase